MDKNKISLNNCEPNLCLTTSIKDLLLGYLSLNFFPKYIRANIGNAVPKEYPITAPIPPHVAADAGPNNIHAPKADATKLAVKEKVPTDLLATK